MVFVVIERDEETLFQHMRKLGMKWPAVKFGTPHHKELPETFEVKAIPTLIILDSAGNLVSKTGYQDVNSAPDEALENWLRAAH